MGSGIIFLERSLQCKGGFLLHFYYQIINRIVIIFEAHEHPPHFQTPPLITTKALKWGQDVPQSPV